ncbi:hypothetical protein CD30_19765 [Ureibacillus massiliensis 4400831 = CIP 108448 = CCUG 49529]|uniref:Uncharacterized protein n=1 Tax=Ureibacillus massiliensis 4400831 = CIP 108448 = CCUG 49529 TaxID=1211035 RepID=A0A0A3I5L3_9BACL|nr:hypothetical protein CD30_19765 [Ureibacillus massiliensis 4400831 = CIP 108448 = CCUG 49529]
MEGAKTPTGTARAEAPGLSVAREKAEAVPVESVAPATEIDDFLICIVNRKKTVDNLKFLSLSTVWNPLKKRILLLNRIFKRLSSCS